MTRTMITSMILAGLAVGQSLTMQGSTTVLPIAQHLAEVYMDAHPEADITVRGGGSGTGIAALIDGATDIANASRAMKAKEVVQARQRGVDPVAHVIALDGIAVIVNKANSLGSTNLENLARIYRGEITNWEKLGGSPGTIVVVSRDAASGTFEVFNEKVLKGAKLTEGALMLASNLEVARTVAQTPGAVGYVGLGYLSDDVKALKVEGVIASEATVQNGTYPLARPLYMYTDGKPGGMTADFINYLLSPAGQTLIREDGFVPVP